jgi:hypothetical protein
MARFGMIHPTVQRGKWIILKSLVRAVGIEPTLLSEPDFESGASTNSTTPARLVYSARLASPNRLVTPHWEENFADRVRSDFRRRCRLEATARRAR